MHRFASGFQGQQILTIVGDDNAGHPDCGMFSEVFEAGVLGLQLHQRIVATADFQHKPAALTVDPEVEILLAAQGF